MPWKDPQKQAEYQRRYLANPETKAKHKESVDRSRKLNAEFRRTLLSSFSCVLCCESDSDLIDWHHVNPDDKAFDIKGSLGTAMNTWWEEVLKCIPVCVLCHRKIHTNKLCLLPIRR